MKKQDYHTVEKLKQMKQVLHDCRTSLATIVMSMEVSLECLSELKEKPAGSIESMNDIRDMVVNSSQEANRLSGMIGVMSEICGQLSEGE